MRRAHLLVCRAGASTLSELAAAGRHPGALPLRRQQPPGVQRPVPGRGRAAEIILNKDFTGEAFAGKINQFLTEPEPLAKMEAASRQLAKPDAAKEIVAGCVALIQPGSQLFAWLPGWVSGCRERAGATKKITATYIKSEIEHCHHAIFFIGRAGIARRIYLDMRTCLVIKERNNLEGLSSLRW